MSKRFKKKWEEQPGGLRKALGYSKPLRPQVNYALNCVETQNQRIKNYVDRYTERDRDLFAKIVQAHERHDAAHASLLANELGEIRRQRNALMSSRIALDNVALRLRTIFEFGNTVSSITPVVDILQSVRSAISGMMPEVASELHRAESTLSNITLDLLGSIGEAVDVNPESEDAAQILREAALVAESRTKAKLPDLLGGISQQSDS